LWIDSPRLGCEYASNWSADVPEARLRAADSVAAYLPPPGWLIRALDAEPSFIDGETLLQEWAR
jgi:hypothetical protein